MVSWETALKFGTGQ